MRVTHLQNVLPQPLAQLDGGDDEAEARTPPSAQNRLMMELSTTSTATSSGYASSMSKLAPSRLACVRGAAPLIHTALFNSPVFVHSNRLVIR